MAGIGKLILGAAEIAGGIAIDVFSGGAAAPLGNILIGMGAGTVASGVGEMIAGDPIKGFATATRSPVQPWKVCYGRVRTGGAMVYLHTWGDQDQMLDMVLVLAAHPSQAINCVLFDMQRVQIDVNAIPTSASAGYSIPAPATGSGTSFTPVQQKITPTSIIRSGSVVTVTLPADIPYLMAGDQVELTNVPGDATLNGVFQVAEIISRVGSVLTFTYLCGGQPANVTNAGYVKTRWADYGRNVYVEYLMGDQTLGETFVGMTAGTPWQGTGKLCTPASPQHAGGDSAPNPWTNYCSLVGKTAVFIRLRYDEKYFRSGLPQISFLMQGKNDIYDSRNGTHGYTENAALCVADFLSNTTWGFKAAYSTEIPTAALNTAANYCDDRINLSKGGTEPRYGCCGQFELTQRRGEILQNLLTSCAGRLTYVGGQFVIHPGIWEGTSPTTVNLTTIASGPFRWRPKPSIRDLFNAVKGTYIAPENKWQSSDFPYYAQDTEHGYSGPSQYGGDIQLEEDGGERRWMELHLPFTISSATAQRIAKIALMRQRYNGTGTFPLTMAGYQFAPLDVLSGSVPFLSFSAKVLEVSAARFAVEEKDNGVVIGTEIDVQQADSAIYAWSTEEELTPQGYVQSHWPTGEAPETTPWPWAPGYVAPLNGDAVWTAGATGPGNFGIQPVTGYDAQGNAQVSVQIKGTPPFSALDTEISKPQISCIAHTTGGSLAPGSYVIGLSAFDSGAADHQNTDYLTLQVVTVAGSGSGSITVNINWGSGDDGGELYIGDWNALGNLLHWNKTVSPGAASSTITAIDRSNPGGPDPLFHHFGIGWLQGVHFGIWAQQIQSVTSNTITLGGTGMTTNMYAGRVLSLLAKWDGVSEVPILNMPVASNTASSGGTYTLTIGTNSAGQQLPNLTTLLAQGDLVVMRHKPTFTAKTFSDALIANPYYPSGATGTGPTGPEVGHVAVVLSGADAGDIQTIASVTTDGSGHYTVFNLAGQWKITPATGDIVVVCAPASAHEWTSAPISTRNGTNSAVVATVNMQNLMNQQWLFIVRTEDAKGNSGSDILAPMRELYIYGSGEASVSVNTDYSIGVDDQNVRVTA